MREVEVRLEMKLADAITELRLWLDHNNYVPVSFDICKKRRDVIVRVVFTEDHMADAFKQEFAR